MGSVDVRQIDLFIVPGVAFCADGRRLGNGWGYYDRLLAGVGSTAVKVGLAFDCQLLPWLPSQEHDVRMDLVVTESRTYPFEPC
jgi:5-formyltetrahydrofolate cyclo-ligase